MLAQRAKGNGRFAGKWDSENGVECGLHFAAGMFVARRSCLGDALAENGSRFFKPAKFRQHLPKMKIRCDVFGMRADELLEMFFSSRVVSHLRAFHRQSVSAKGVMGMDRHESLQHFPAALGFPSGPFRVCF